MIKHLVFFKLAEMAEGKTKAENALIIKEQLEALKPLIPEIVSIQVHINHPQASPDNYDIVLNSEFRTLEDLKTYADHPEHLRVAEFVGKVRTARAAIDYEV